MRSIDRRRSSPRAARRGFIVAASVLVAGAGVGTACSDSSTAESSDVGSTQNGPGAANDATAQPDGPWLSEADGTGDVTADASDPTYVFIAGGNTVASFEWDAANLTLQPVGSEPTGGNTQSLAAHPSGRFLYTANLGVAAAGDPQTVGVYLIDATGALSRQDTDPVAPGTQDKEVLLPGDVSWPVRSVAVHPTKDVLFVSGADLTTFSIDPKTGLLSAPTRLALGAAAGDTLTSWIAVDPLGRYLAVRSQVGSVRSITMCLLDASGRPTASQNFVDPPSDAQPSGLGPVGAFDAMGAHLFVTSSAGGGSVHSFSVNPTTAVLTDAGSAASGAFLGSGYTFRLAGLAPYQGSFIYSAGTNQGKVEPFSVSDAGAPTYLAGTAYDASATWALGIDPANHHLFSVSAGVPPGAPQVEVFAIQATTGVLTRVGAPTPISLTGLDSDTWVANGVAFARR